MGTIQYVLKLKYSTIRHETHSRQLLLKHREDERPDGRIDARRVRNVEQLELPADRRRARVQFG